MLVVLHMVAQPPVFALWDIPQQGQGPYCPRALWLRCASLPSHDLGQGRILVQGCGTVRQRALGQ